MEFKYSIPNSCTGLVNVQSDSTSQAPTIRGPYKIPKKQGVLTKPLQYTPTHTITFSQVQLGSLRKQVTKIININSHTSNHFLVTDSQVVMLKKSNFPQTTDPSTWLQVVAGYNKFWIWKYHKVKKNILTESNIRLHLYPTSLAGIKSIYRDQQNRATHIVKHMMTYGQKHLVTMDGHGRFVMCILLELLRMRQHLKDYTITLFDKDHITNEWHRTFMPSNVNVIEGDILETSYTHANVCVYLNFCSIGKNSDKLNDFISCNKQFFLSFTDRGSVSGHVHGVSSLVDRVKELGQLVSSRSSFKTYYI